MKNKLILFICSLFFITLILPTKEVYADDMSYEEFVQYAIDASNEQGIYTSIMLAQYFLESGAKVSNGKISLSGLASAPNYNLFGIKGSYKGQSVNYRTLEDDGYGNKYAILADFRKYPSHKESFIDNSMLLINQPGHNPQVKSGALKGNSTQLYSCTWKKYATSIEDSAKCLQGTYATDTAYASKLLSIIETRDLEQYDGQSSSSGSSSKDSDSSNDTPKNMYVGEDAWKNKMVNFQDRVYKQSSKVFNMGSNGFINNAFIVGLDGISLKLLDYAYIAMMVITTTILFLMTFSLIFYLVVLPNYGGTKMGTAFKKISGIDPFVSKHNTIDILSKFGIAVVIITMVYANVIPVFLQGIFGLLQWIVSIF